MPNQCNPISAPDIPVTPGITTNDLEIMYSFTDGDFRTNTLQQKITSFVGMSTFTTAVNGLIAANSPVKSVNSQTGVVVLNTGNIAEGGNQYFTNSRADARINAQKNVANGVPSLGVDIRIAMARLPLSVQKALVNINSNTSIAAGTTFVIADTAGGMLNLLMYTAAGYGNVEVTFYKPNSANTLRLVAAAGQIWDRHTTSSNAITISGNGIVTFISDDVSRWALKSQDLNGSIVNS